MDSLTQVVLGGAVGEACLGRKVGNKAVLWGAVAGTIPDLDVLANFFISGAAEQAHFHRGPSHSLVFSLVVAPLLGAMIARIHRKEGLGVKPWAWLSFLGLVTHPLLDIFTTWGTEFLWPFYGDRIALNSIFVIDPGYTLPFLVCLLIVLFMRRNNPRRRIVNWIGIGWSCLYLTFSLVQKARARDAFEAEFAKRSLKVEQFMTKPTPLNIFLWGAVAKTPEGFYLGYHSLPGGQEDIHLQLYETSSLPQAVSDNPSIQLLKFLSKGYFLVQEQEEGWLISDLRYMTADMDLQGDETFIFKYDVYYGSGGKLIIEQKRSIPSLTGKDLSRFWELIWNGY